MVTDTLPAGVTFVSATGGGTLSGNVVTWPTIASLASGASQGYSVTVTAPATGVLTNIVASTSTTGDPDPSNNNGSAPGARVTTTVIEQADVATTKTGPATVNAGQNFTYALTVSNTGPSAAATVVVTDTLPAGVTFVSATNGGTLSGNVITWPAIASLASGANQAYSVTVTAPATGVLTNILASTSPTADPNPGNNNGSAPASRVTTTIIEVADIVTTQDRSGHGDCRDQLQLRDRRPERRSVDCCQRAGDRHAAGGCHLRLGDGRRHAERECHHLARHRDHGKRCHARPTP